MLHPPPIIPEAAHLANWFLPAHVKSVKSDKNKLLTNGFNNNIKKNRLLFLFLENQTLKCALIWLFWICLKHLFLSFGTSYYLFCAKQFLCFFSIINLLELESVVLDDCFVFCLSKLGTLLASLMTLLFPGCRGGVWKLPLIGLDRSCDLNTGLWLAAGGGSVKIFRKWAENSSGWKMDEYHCLWLF